VNAWFVASLALLAATVPLGLVLIRADALSRLVALEVFAIIVSLTLLTLAEAFERSFYASLGLVLAVMSLIGSLAFARFLERHL
jgi:multisubunit Na+/H+ antiporter MnhF subunit